MGMASTVIVSKPPSSSSIDSQIWFGTFVEIEGRIVASGLGICDRGYIGIYAIYVSPSCRRRHYARAICSTLLAEGIRQGASRAYLQVVQGNIAAKSLYIDLGFYDFYTYWFRSHHQPVA